MINLLILLLNIFAVIFIGYLLFRSLRLARKTDALLEKLGKINKTIAEDTEKIRKHFWR